MDSTSWDELGLLVAEAIDLSPDEREAFLDEACRSDPTLRAEAESLIAAYDEAPSYFKHLGTNVDSLARELFLGVPSSEAPPGDDSSSDLDRLIGQTVDHYEVTDHLGGGGMGVVYKARDTRLQRTVALKFLPFFLNRNEKARRRFLQEARAASALDHPHICTIYDVGQADDGRHFIAMAYYEGETLEKKIDRGPLPIETALDLAVQIAEGLDQAHRRGIVHRDVKPANVMVTSDGLVKMLDFGLAKLRGETQLTRTGAMLGTAAYMSPEQIHGHDVDHRTDVWSLGVVLYEMIAGQRPFVGDFGPAVLYGVLNLNPQPITGLRDDVPMQLAHVINKALAKSPAQRYQHASDLLDDLNAVRQRNAARSTARETVLPPSDEPGRKTDRQRPLQKDHGPVKILVVDDEPELELLVRQKFRRQVRTGEWSFSYALDGREALDCLERDPEIAIVLTDLNMPRMDGLTLLARLDELDGVVKAVVVSAYGDMDNIRMAMNRGAFDFVTKPIDFDDLETTIRKTWKEVCAYRKATEAQRQFAAMQKEMEVARRIQEAILPVSFPERDEFDAYAFSTTSRDVSGTFYDIFEREDGRIGVLIGDASGKGVSAALFMAMSQTFLKGVAQQTDTPGTCLSMMNRLLSPEDFPDLAVTVFYGLLDLSTGELTYGNAGHPSPYLLHPAGTIEPVGTEDQPPIWQRRDTEYETTSHTLQPGDGLFLFTRGVTDAVDEHGQPYSVDRLAALLRKKHDLAPTLLIRDVVRAVMQFTENAPLADDLTLLALRYVEEKA